jgi:hypothetical protein
MTDQGIDIVRVASHAAAVQTWKDISFEPAFFTPDTRLTPIFPMEDWGTRYAEHLGFHLSLHAHDLLAHVRRILLWAAAGDRKATYRATSDLFQVLGTKGMDLRRDILNRVRRVLSQPQIVSLQSLLTETEDLKPVAELPTSRFAPKLEGKLVSVDFRAKRAIATRTPLDEARECLENGQVEEAQRILEAALQQNTDNPALHRELLEIYRRAGDLKACEAMFRQLARHTPDIEQDWEQTMTFLQGTDMD